MARTLSVTLLAVMAFVPLHASALTLIHAGRLIDGSNNRVLAERTVVVDGERIVAVERGYRSPAAGDTLVDLRQHTVMPGWIDMHVHLDHELSKQAYAEKFRLSEADFALLGAEHARRTLMAGFTTVRDLGGRHDWAVPVALARAIAAGTVPGPRVFAAGKSLATTGGHADPTNGVHRELRGDPGPAEGVVNGTRDGVKAVRHRYKEGADLIKITATGGVLSEARSGQNAQFTIAEIEAITATAADYGFRVAAHAHGTEGIRRAVLGGVDSIEHGTFMTPEIMALMKKRGTWYVPTISAGRFVGDKAKEPGYFSPVIQPKAEQIGPIIQDTFAAAYRAGVKIAFGTDCGVCPHGDNWKEFIYMVEAGMPAVEAIIAATGSAAELLGEADSLGQLKAGYLADIVAVPGDPRDDINLMGQVAFIMQGGNVVTAP